MYLFRWTREPEPRWVEALRRLSAPAERLAHLELWWESGTPADPIQRWVLYECVPVPCMTADTLTALSLAPPCRCVGWQPNDYTVCDHCHGIQSPGRLRIWESVIRRGLFPRPFWVIQGTHGGHKYRYTPQERSWALWAGLLGEPPVPGELPYAEPDNRTWGRIRELDRLRSAFADLAQADEATRHTAEQELRRATIQQFNTEMYDTVRDTWGALAPRIYTTHTNRWAGVDDDRTDADYVSTGSLNHVGAALL